MQHATTLQPRGLRPFRWTTLLRLGFLCPGLFRSWISRVITIPPQHTRSPPHPAHCPSLFQVPPKIPIQGHFWFTDSPHFIQNLSEHIHISDPNPPAGTGDRNRYNSQFNFSSQPVAQQCLKDPEVHTGQRSIQTTSIPKEVIVTTIRCFYSEWFGHENRWGFLNYLKSRNFTEYLFKKNKFNFIQ